MQATLIVVVSCSLFSLFANGDLTKSTSSAVSKVRELSDLVCSTFLKAAGDALDSVQDTACSALSVEKYAKEVCDSKLCSKSSSKRDSDRAEINRDKRGIGDVVSGAGKVVNGAGESVKKGITDGIGGVTGALCTQAGCDSRKKTDEMRKDFCNRKMTIKDLRAICNCIGILVNGVEKAGKSGSLNLLNIEGVVVNTIVDGIECASKLQHIFVIRDTQVDVIKALKQQDATLVLLPEFNYQFYARFGTKVATCGLSSGAACQPVIQDVVAWIKLATQQTVNGLAAYGTYVVQRISATLSKDLQDHMDRLTTGLNSMLQACKLDTLKAHVQSIQNTVVEVKAAFSPANLDKITDAINALATLLNTVSKSPKEFIDPKALKDFISVPMLIQKVLQGGQAASNIEKALADSRNSIARLNVLINKVLTPLRTQFQNCKKGDKTLMDQINILATSTTTKADEQFKQLLTMVQKAVMIQLEVGLKPFDYFLSVEIEYPCIEDKYKSEVSSLNKFIAYFHMCKAKFDGIDLIVPGFIPYIKFLPPF